MPVAEAARDAVEHLEKVKTNLLIVARHEHTSLVNKAALAYETRRLENVIDMLRRTVKNLGESITINFTGNH